MALAFRRGIVLSDFLVNGLFYFESDNSLKLSGDHMTPNQGQG